MAKRGRRAEHERKRNEYHKKILRLMDEGKTDDPDLAHAMKQTREIMIRATNAAQHALRHIAETDTPDEAKTGLALATMAMMFTTVTAMDDEDGYGIAFDTLVGTIRDMRKNVMPAVRADMEKKFGKMEEEEKDEKEPRWE